MKLYGTPTSPYVRVVRMALCERGLASRVEVLAVPTRAADSPVNSLVPTGKVPTLVTDDGERLCESRLICQYLDRFHDAGPVVDPDPPMGERLLEGVVTGLLDGVSVWVRELRRPTQERSPGILAQEEARAGRCVPWFEARVEELGERVDYPRLCLVAALYVLDERIATTDWRSVAPRLATWFDGFRSRESYRATAPS